MKTERSAMSTERGVLGKRIQRLAVLAICELVVLQPALAAPLSQIPMFTVTSVAPPPDFKGCTRHGVQSHDFGRFGSAYSLAGT